MNKHDAIEVHIEPRLLDRRRMALALCLSEDTLDRLRARGCPSVSVPGTRTTLFDPDDVVAWMKANQEPETPSLKTAKEGADLVFGAST